MTFEVDLKGVLDDVVPRTFPDFAPTGTARPYCTYQAIGGEVINPVSNAAPGKKHAEVQVNVWADSRAEASALIASIEVAMRGATAFQARPISAPISDAEPDLRRYGSLQSFSCWYDA